MNVIYLKDLNIKAKPVPTAREQLLHRDMKVRQDVMEKYQDYRNAMLVGIACTAAGDALRMGLSYERALQIADDVIKDGYYIPEPILTVEEKS
jgi:hypothetical protein